MGAYPIDFPKCLILEYIDGISLNKILKSFPFTETHTVDSSIQLAEAIYYLHTHGEVHKRIRPSKILIDNELRPIISPFEMLEVKQTYINKNHMIDELLYISPELLSGIDAEPDEKSDQFSLALVIYEMATGEPLFYRAPLTVRNVFHKRRNFFKDGEIKEYTLSKIKNPELREILEKMLSEQPSKRYFSMLQVIEKLKSIKIKKDKNVELALASYRRCCVRNKDFSSDFYSILFKHEKYGDKIKSYFDLDESDGSKRNRNRKLRSALLLLLGDIQEDSMFEKIHALTGHQGLDAKMYKAFMEQLIITVSKNDYLWDDYKESGGNELENAWNNIKNNALKNLTMAISSTPSVDYQAMHGAKKSAVKKGKENEKTNADKPKINS